MKRALALFAFPRPCVALYQGDELIYGEVREFGLPCEQILPAMIESFLQCHELSSVPVLSTFCGPGPFTALRASQAFALGLGAGFPGMKVYQISFFHLFPSSSLAIASGTQWILEDGTLHAALPPQTLPISPHHYDVSKTLDLAHRLVRAIL